LPRNIRACNDRAIEASSITEGQVVADLMLRSPKTLPADARVSDARAVLENPSVQMVLLVDGQRLAGAIAELPPDAPSSESAICYADATPDTIGPDEPASQALARTASHPHRRLIVVDEQARLLGLLCLNKSRTRFCGAAGNDAISPEAAPSAG